MGTEGHFQIISLRQQLKGRCQNIWAAGIRFARRKPLGAISGVVIVLIGLIAIFAPVLAPQDPLKNNFDSLATPPHSSHHLGTDDNGRDVFSRLIYGSRVSLLVAASAVGLGTMFGFMWGLVSGSLSGRVDFYSQRLLELIMAFPEIILALMLMVPLGSGIGSVTIVIAITRLPWATRVVRSVAIATRESGYVEAARGIGASEMRILLKHVAPACIPAMLIIASAHLGVAIILEASLGFLGVGVPPPTATWGAMLADSVQQVVQPLWWLAIFPGIAITGTVLAFSLLGDAIRDELDPKLRGTT